MSELIEREDVMERLFLFLTKDYYWIEEDAVGDITIHKVRLDDKKGRHR